MLQTSPPAPKKVWIFAKIWALLITTWAVWASHPSGPNKHSGQV